MSQSIKLPKLLQEGCVLQRGEKTRIWGWYKPQAELEVTFQEKVYSFSYFIKKIFSLSMPPSSSCHLFIKMNSYHFTDFPKYVIPY